MLITCDASAEYSDAFSDYNLPGREVSIHLFITQSVSVCHLCCFLNVHDSYPCIATGQTSASIKRNLVSADL